MGAQAVRLSNVDIDNALKNKDFEVLFQPIFDLGNGALARMETFIRWRHQGLGMLPPGAFISFFETQGRMSELTRYVLAEALDSYLDWRGPYAPGFSINLALTDLSDEAFASHFTKLLRDRNFPADLVTLECPMPPVDMDMETASAIFERLSSTGARLAIEVRSRANDLLRTIDPFPFDEIKTGGPAILRFARTVRGPGLTAISDLLDIANRANAAITAVGVEDQASLAALRGLGFTAAQGNHLSKVGNLKDFRPGRVNEVRELLDLEPLDADSLTALFRTEAPAPQPAAAQPPPQVENETPESDEELVERLNERVARQAVTQSASTEAEEAETEDEAEAQQKALAREKARAIALAKRAKAREDRKNAAIERAKAKAAQTRDDDFEFDDDEEEEGTPSPRALQERINKEFSPTQRQAQPLQPAPREAAPPPPPPAAKAKQAPPPQQPAPTKTLPGEADISLAVSGARAYFQPEIRVANPALRSKPAQQTPQVQPAPQQQPEPAPQPETTHHSVREAFLKTATPAQKARTMPAQEVTKAPDDDSLLGDLHREPEEEATATAARRKKGFLTRTVIPYPTYFWPRSWKRRYHRWIEARHQSGSDDVKAAE
jgi:EAL domain-containing protein (putative c-di-GMP-specific phosphodiesterase class I)